MTDLKLPLSCAELLPHRAPMLLAGELLEYQPGQARMRAVVEPGNLFLDARGVLDAAAIIELAAQGTAALKGYEARRRGEPVKIGYLVGIRDFALEGQARAGDRLEILVRLEFAMEQAALMQCEVRRGPSLLGAGTIKIWEEREWPAAPARPAEDDRGADNPRDGFKPDGASRVPASDPIGRALAGALESLEPPAAENQVAGTFRFGDDFAGFQGHFPAYPILPAVLMPRLALLLAEISRGGALPLRRITQAKIGQGIFPGERIRVEVRQEEALEVSSGFAKLKARLTGPRGPVANFSLECGGSVPTA